MNNQTKEKLMKLVQAKLLEQDRIGCNVKSNKPIDYNALVHIELNKLENLVSAYSCELTVISKFIRRTLFCKGFDKELYNIIHRLNQEMLLFSNAVGEDVFWDIETVKEYAFVLLKCMKKHLTQKDVDKLMDDIYMANAKKIILPQWEDVLSANNGLKAFIDIFDDVFTNTIEKYPNKFIYELKNTDVLCRMVKEKDCDENRFIPWSECTYQNRWNPPGKSFLYMSYGKVSHPFDEFLTLEERVCLLECRTEPNTDCSFCRFTPVKPGKILDLSFNDTEFVDYLNMLDNFGGVVAKAIFNDMISNKEIIAHAHILERMLLNRSLQWNLSD